MIRPNATRPSVSRSRRWYSTCTGGAVRRGGRRRGFGGGSGGTGHLLRQAEDRVAGSGRGSGGFDRSGQRARALEGDAGGVEGLGDRVGGCTDEVGPGDGRSGYGCG